MSNTTTSLCDIDVHTVYGILSTVLSFLVLAVGFVIKIQNDHGNTLAISKDTLAALNASVAMLTPTGAAASSSPNAASAGTAPAQSDSTSPAATTPASTAPDTAAKTTQ